MSQLPEIRSLWNFSKPEESEQRFRDLLPAAEEAGDESYRLQLLTQIARTYSLRGQFAEAHEILDQVEAQISTAPIVELRYLLERGRCFNSDNQADKASDLFQKAWQVGRDAHLDTLAIDAAHMVAIAEKDPQQQIIWNEKALELAESSPQPDTERWLGALYNNLGWTYHDEIQNYERALMLFQKGLQWREDSGGNAGGIRIAKWSVARALRSLERVEEALKMQQALREKFEAAGEDDPFNLEELGECLLALGHVEDSKTYFAQAYPRLKALGWIEEARLDRIKSLSE